MPERIRHPSGSVFRRQRLRGFPEAPALRNRIEYPAVPVNRNLAPDCPPGASRPSRVLKI